MMGPTAAAVEPLDYEEYILEQRRLGEASTDIISHSGERKSKLKHLVEFPKDDIEVKVKPRKIRTMGHILPEETV